MLEIKSFTFNDYQENTYIVSENGNCIIIDPGNYQTNENKEIKDYIDDLRLIPQSILITHCHIDHVLGIDFLVKEFSVNVYIPESEINLYRDIENYAPLFNLEKYNHFSNIKFLDLSKKIIFENQSIKLLNLPGHSPGHVGFYFIENNICFSGDVIFKNSIGRTDLPGGNYDTLISSIKNELFLLDDSLKIYPGHGPTTTIFDERKNNPFLN